MTESSNKSPGLFDESPGLSNVSPESFPLVYKEIFEEVKSAQLRSAAELIKECSKDLKKLADAITPPGKLTYSSDPEHEIFTGAINRLVVLEPFAWVTDQLTLYVVDQLRNLGIKKNYVRDVAGKDALRAFSVEYVNEWFAEGGCLAVNHSDEGEHTDIAKSVVEKIVVKANTDTKSVIFWHLGDLPFTPECATILKEHLNIGTILFSGWEQGVGDLNYRETLDKLKLKGLIGENIVAVYESFHVGVEDRYDNEDEMKRLKPFRKGLNSWSDGSLEKALKDNGVRVEPGPSLHAQSGVLAFALLACQMNDKDSIKKAVMRLEELVNEFPEGPSNVKYSEIFKSLNGDPTEDKVSEIGQAIETALKEIRENGRVGGH